MQFKETFRTLILPLSAAACLVASCISVDKSMGSQFIPDDEKLQVYTVSLPLPVELRMADSMQAVTASAALLGGFRSEEFGVTSFSTAANVCPVMAGAVRFGKDPVIKSVYFATAIGNTQVMDDSQTGIPQNIEVFRLTRPVDTTMCYNNSLSGNDYDPVPLNTGAVTYFGGDSIKIYLDNRYGAELLTATEEQLDSLGLFVKRFTGLYLTASLPEEGLTGGRLNSFVPSGASIVLNYSFQPEWEAGLPRKDTVVSLVFAGDGYCLNLSSYGSESLETDDTSQMTELPVEGIAGIKPFINIKTLKGMFDQWLAANQYDPRKILLIKGEYELPFEMPDDYKQMERYPASLFPAYREKVENSELIYYFQPSDIYSSGNPATEVDRSSLAYRGDLSATLQRILRTPLEDLTEDGNIPYNLWFMPSTQNTDTYGNTYYTVQNTLYYNGKINGPAAERHPVVTFVYTVLY